ncbi:MAG: uroporphyrinogen decarboxylase family protein [Dehalobacterium sp.]
MTETETLFQERANRFSTAANLQEPDRVPVMSLIETYAIAYANSTVNECLESHEKEFEIYGKVFKDIYFDGTTNFGINRAMNVYTALGSNAYFISQDSSTLQHDEDCPMTVEDYPAFIRNPEQFTTNELFKRKYPNLSLPYPQNKEALKKAAFEVAGFGKKMGDGALYLKQMGIPLTTSVMSIAPLDMIFDYYRGFAGMMLDMRRVPEMLAEAADALVDTAIMNATHGASQLAPFPWVFTPLHCPYFIGPQKFGELFWPSYKKFLMAIHERGGKVFAFLEGNWEKYYEFLQELPKGLLIASLEADDIIEAKKKIGNTVTLSGGMPINKLKYSTEQECIDYAKNIVDHCAPGGGYIFTTNLCLVSGGDVNSANYRAVNNFVHEYGQYKK